MSTRVSLVHFPRLTHDSHQVVVYGYKQLEQTGDVTYNRKDTASSPLANR